MNEPTPQELQVETLLADYDKEFRTIDASKDSLASKITNDPMLSPQGRADALAKLEADFSGKAEAIRTRAVSAMDTRINAVQKEMSLEISAQLHTERKELGDVLFSQFLKSDIEAAPLSEVKAKFEAAPDAFTKRVIGRHALPLLADVATAEAQDLADTIRAALYGDANRKRTQKLFAYETARDWASDVFNPNREEEIRRRFNIR